MVSWHFFLISSFFSWKTFFYHAFKVVSTFQLSPFSLPINSRKCLHSSFHRTFTSRLSFAGSLNLWHIRASSACGAVFFLRIVIFHIFGSSEKNGTTLNSLQFSLFSSSLPPSAHISTDLVLRQFSQLWTELQHQNLYGPTSCYWLGCNFIPSAFLPMRFTVCIISSLNGKCIIVIINRSRQIFMALRKSELAKGTEVTDFAKKKKRTTSWMHLTLSIINTFAQQWRHFLAWLQKLEMQEHLSNISTNKSDYVPFPSSCTYGLGTIDVEKLKKNRLVGTSHQRWF